MKCNWWICLIMLFGIILISGGIVWWWQRRRPERIALSDLPRLRPSEPEHRVPIGRRDGRPTPVKLVS